VQVLLCDAQTSGGLLVALSEAAADTLVERLAGSATVIGRVVSGQKGAVTVL